MLYEIVESTIAAGGTESDLVDIGNRAIVGLIMPAIVSAALTFKVAANPADTPVLVKNLALTALTVSASVGGIAIDCDALVGLSGFRYIQIVSGATQTSAVTFKWVVKG